MRGTWGPCGHHTRFTQYLSLTVNKGRALLCNPGSPVPKILVPLNFDSPFSCASTITSKFPNLSSIDIGGQLTVGCWGPMLHIVGCLATPLALRPGCLQHPQLQVGTAKTSWGVWCLLEVGQPHRQPPGWPGAPGGRALPLAPRLRGLAQPGAR